MTVRELSSRITMPELEEWMIVARQEHEEREKHVRIQRVESRAKAMRARAGRAA